MERIAELHRTTGENEPWTTPLPERESEAPSTQV